MEKLNRASLTCRPCMLRGSVTKPVQSNLISTRIGYEVTQSVGEGGKYQSGQWNYGKPPSSLHLSLVGKLQLSLILVLPKNSDVYWAAPQVLLKEMNNSISNDWKELLSPTVQLMISIRHLSF